MVTDPLPMQPDQIVYTGPFDPRLCDGISGSIFDLLRFLHHRGQDVKIVSLMHEGFSLSAKLNTLSPRHHAEILHEKARRVDFVMDGISISHEELPFTRREVMHCHPEVLARYVEKIREYPGSHFFTVDDDCTGLVAHSVAGSIADHFILSPVDAIDTLKQVPNYVQMLKRRNVFTVSKYARDALWKECGIPSHVWPPVIDLSRVTGSLAGSQEMVIGYYSAGVHKGDAIMDHLIEMLRDRRFLVMGTQSELRLPKPNVAFPGHIRDPDQFFGNLSLLLVPSMIPEGCPRVILEAAAYGVPTIANRIGGIPEAIGNSGILVDVEPSARAMAERYCGIIRELLDDFRRYTQLQERARQRTIEYQEEIVKVSTDHIEEFFCH